MKLKGLIRWRSLGLRERWLLSICGVVFIFTIMKYGLLIPMSYYKQQVERDYTQAKIEFENAHSLLNKFGQLQNNLPEKRTYALSRSVEESLQQHQLQKIKWYIDGKEITIEPTEVEFDLLIAWLIELEVKYGVYVNEIDFDKYASESKNINLKILRLQRNE